MSWRKREIDAKKRKGKENNANKMTHRLNFGNVFFINYPNLFGKAESALSRAMNAEILICCLKSHWTDAWINSEQFQLVASSCRPCPWSYDHSSHKCKTKQKSTQPNERTRTRTHTPKSPKTKWYTRAHCSHFIIRGIN